MAAWQAPCFTKGHIPEIEPPVAVCG
jgi:hypothetical protein